MQRFPVISTMPNLSVIFEQLEVGQGTVKSGKYVCKKSKMPIDLLVRPQTTAHNLLICDSKEENLVTFCEWPGTAELVGTEIYPRHQKFWSASGFLVSQPREGIGSAMYALAQIYLAIQGISIAPSDNVMRGGVAFWRHIDPSISWELPDEKDASRPDLGGLNSP